MKALNKGTAPKTQRPERIIQFGEGNFLRAFVDWIIYNMNQKTDFNSSVVVVQPDRKSTRLNSSHTQKSRMPSSA